MQTRRRFLAGLASGGVLTVAGCSEGSPTDTETTPAATTDPATPTSTTTDPATTDPVDILVSPDGGNNFDPETLTVTAGDTVTWKFVTPGHNVSAIPDAHPKVDVPDGAQPFASYEGTYHYTVNQPGTTYSTTVSTPGEYVYVCVPHAGLGMVGRLVVTE